MLVYTSASSQRTGGIGLFIRKRYVHSLQATHWVSDRILVIRFNSNPELTIICTHAPTESALKSEWDSLGECRARYPNT